VPTPLELTVQDRSAARDSAQVQALVRSLPHLARLVGKIVVVKIGGSLGGEGTALEDIVLLRRLGVKPVIVHGGGPMITDLSARLGLETRFVDGRRYTDQATLDAARMALVGQVNGDVVAELNRLGGMAIGLCGLDGQLIQARLRDEALGLVGDVERFDLRPLRVLVDAGYTVAVAPIASGPDASPLNVNADSVAGDLARSLMAEKLILFTDVPGVLDADGQVISELTAERVKTLIAAGSIRGGMIPKVEACLRALETVPRVHILDGREPHALIEELFTDSGVGTMIVAEPS